MKGLHEYVDEILDTAKEGVGAELSHLEVGTWVNNKQEFHVSIKRIYGGYVKASIAVPVEQIPELIRELALTTATFMKAVDTARGGNNG
jgi:hypothetical protein